MELLSEIEMEEKLRTPTDERVFVIAEAFRRSWQVEEIHRLSKIDRWFLRKMEKLVAMETRLRGRTMEELTPELLLDAKKMGFNDHHLGELTGLKETDIRARRKQFGIKPVYKIVDTCAAEFEAVTPYYYSTYEMEDEG
jgi:carbamoyl-phosphate synthase large subunit